MQSGLAPGLQGLLSWDAEITRSRLETKQNSSISCIPLLPKSRPRFPSTHSERFSRPNFRSVKEVRLLAARWPARPAWVGQIASSLINIVALLAVFLSLFALVSVLERKILARIQTVSGQTGSGPLACSSRSADGIKMLIKEDIVPLRADKVVHFLAPILIAATAILALGIIPYGRNMTPVFNRWRPALSSRSARRRS